MKRPTTIPIGPQHPAFLEPLNIGLELEEERVVGATLNLGYNHRGMEYALALDYKKTQYLVERVCGICSNHHSAAYCQTMEDIYDIEVPVRAKVIRTIMMECQRITSHLLALGHTAETMGYENLFMQCFRERELAMRLVNEISGNRVHYSINVIGGIKRDMDAGMERHTANVMRELRPLLEDLRDVFARDNTLVKRMKDVGVLTNEQARDWCTVGPVARASGLPQDIREDGFAAYDMIDLKPVVRDEGDCYARTMVRMDECLHSIDLIEECLKLLDEGPVIMTVKGHPTGEGLSRVEAPRGELLYHVKAIGGLQLDRIKIRTPAFLNVPSVQAMLPGSRLADVPLITVSVDPCICCTDR
ncbi:MAG: NADH-quinone oxidoreductase subunit D [Euryarchaeota archaeon]|mgnify:CR=1 FL=1|nr:NADH-quinone oxidoreductase subunit D [Euryarchaeota archaeon]